MATNPNDTHARKSIGKFARTLLATTCLTVASGGAAVAGTITYNEGAGLDNSLGTATPLSAATIPGTTIVTGDLFGEDTFDYFELTGLGTGTFTVQASEVEGGDGYASIFNTGGTTLEGPSLFQFGAPANFGSQAIPLDGNLVIEVDSVAGAFYQVTVDTTASAAPEPGTLLTAGLGLAGALALTRRRRKQ